MIPKIIHYCWLSNEPIPEDLKVYIQSWKNKLPDYEFMLWNFDRFDINRSIWVKEAFESKKYAFAADYIRLYAVYNYGGIYLDIDVEVVKSFDNFLHLPMILGYEKSIDKQIEMAAFGAEKKSEWVGKCLAYYDNRHFIKDGKFDTKVLPSIINQILEINYEITPVRAIPDINKIDRSKILIFSYDFFSPKSYETGKITLTTNSVTIHHFSGSWLPAYIKLEKKIWLGLKLNNKRILERIIRKLRFI